MSVLPTTGLPLVEEDEATGEVAALYDEAKRELQLPVVPNILKGLAASPESLEAFWHMWLNSIHLTTLPESLTSMISYTIASESNCTYCSSTFELSCRTLGVDEETLDRLVKDLDNVNPLRIRAIIEFSLKVAKHPQSLVREDYDRLRDLGVTEAEIVEIILVSALSVLDDIVADALQIEVDPIITDALAEMR